MSTIHQTGPFVEWILATLRADGLIVGFAHKPDDDDIPAGAGYSVVYPIPGGSTSGSIDAPRSDATVAVQITSSATRPDQAADIADRVRVVLDVAIPATLTGGRRVIFGDFPEGSPSVDRDDQVQPPRYFVPDRFEFGTA